MISFLSEQIQQNWHKWFDTPLPAFQWSLYSNSFDNMHDNVLFFAIPTGQTSPLLVGKSCRHPAYASTLNNEFEKLSTAWQHAGNLAQTRLPRPLGLWQHGLDKALLITFCPGETLAYHLSKQGNEIEIIPLFQRAAQWLGNLHQSCLTKQKPPESSADFTPHAQTFRQLFQLSPTEEIVLQKLEEKMERSVQNRNYVTLLQGDFWPGNCLAQSDKKALRVVDWQYARWGKEVNLDVYLFLVASARVLAKQDSPEAWGLATAQQLMQWQAKEVPAFLETYHQFMPANETVGILPPLWGMLATCVEMGTRPYITFNKLQPDTSFWQVFFTELAKNVAK